VTVFVNPLQFGAGEDLDGYPRDLAGDRAAAEAEGVDVLFTPSVAEMYPEPTRTTVHVDGLTAGLCGAARPTHFDGVTTVVTKLFAIVGPCSAYFGRKDAQQLAVVRRMAMDLDLPVTVVGCPLVREPDGVAMSSRNAYLSAEERQAATVLSRALRAAAEAVVAGERDPGRLTTAIEGLVAAEPLVEHEYAEVRRADDLAPVERLDGDVLVAVAARVGGARLIDNVTITIADAEIITDLGVITQGS
jgi:pantoate--beta-alanine ligase